MAILESPPRPNELVINDKNWTKFVNPVVNGEKKICRTIPRNYSLLPLGSLWCAAEWDLPLIPDNEVADRFEQQLKDKAQLSDVRNAGNAGQPIPAVDQNGKGYCWAHSGVSCMRVGRAALGEPFADLSAYSIACIIKKYRDEGGWGIEGVKFAAERGCPTSQFWPNQSMAKANDNEATWANAKLHRWTEWRELSNNPEEKRRQMLTCFLLGWPMVFDCDWWGHSIMGCDLTKLDTKTLKILQDRILNSWGVWSDNGMGLLDGSKAIPDNCVACILTTPSTI